MIFVTVGTDEHDFSRLVKKMDEIAGKVKEDIVMQIGYTKYTPKNARWFRFTSSNEIERLYKNARLIICHAGAGSIIKALSYGKKPVVVPRRKRYREHVNDHQVDVAKFLDKKKRVYACMKIDDLERIVVKGGRSLNHKNGGKRRLVKFIKDYLRGVENEKDKRAGDN